MSAYTWENIEKFLIARLKKCTAILTFGTIGSRDINHDVDIIVTKKPNSSSSLFYKELHDILGDLNLFLRRKYHKKIVRFTCFSHEKEVLKIGNYKKGDLALHVMDYVSLSQLERNWAPHVLKGFSFLDFLKNNYYLLLGNIDSLFSKSFSKSRKYDAMFLFLSHCDRINSNYPSSFLVDCMNHLYHYISKRISLKKPLVAKTQKDVKRVFYKLCDILDKLNRRKGN